MNNLATSIVIAAFSLAACTSGESDTPGQEAAPETPAQAIRAIIQLYEARDFDSLIRTRYAEIWKADNEQQIQTLVDRFSTRFADNAMLTEAISTYESVIEITPVLSEDDTVAVFNMDHRFVKLSRMPDGNWGFHL